MSNKILDKKNSICYTPQYQIINKQEYMKNVNDFEEKYKGKKYGKLTILRQAANDVKAKDGKVFYVRTLCDCGLEKTMLLNNIIYGFSKSCGCQRALAVSRTKRIASKLTIDTPLGAKTISDLSRQFDVPYGQIYARYNEGIRDVDNLIGKRKRKEQTKIVDERLNGMNQKEAAKEFKVSAQLISFRLKKGWIINADNKWVSPHRGIVGRRVYRPSKIALRRLKKQRALKTIICN